MVLALVRHGASQIRTGSVQTVKDDGQIGKSSLQAVKVVSQLIIEGQETLGHERQPELADRSESVEDQYTDVRSAIRQCRL